LTSIEVKPYTALVTCPEAVAMSVGRAKNARYAREWPSRSINSDLDCVAIVHRWYGAGESVTGWTGTLASVADGFHPPVEEYLEAIHELEEERTTVIQARLAERLGYTAPAVSEMMRRLRDEGYVTVKGRAVNLTDQGRSKAESVVRKHRLAERLLTDVIGLPWHKSHLEACRWEHVISDEVEARLIDLLGHPTTCPHGNPIPGTGPARQGLTALSDARGGDHVRLERVTEQVEIDLESLEYLSAHGFVPGCEATVSSRAPDGTLTLDLGAQHSIALGPGLAGQLWVDSVA
jgi:DtxR family Mn-dependent transcriptional regulator